MRSANSVALGPARRAKRRLVAASLAVIVGSGVIAALPTAAMASPSIVSQTYGYTGATTTFTVPAGVTQLTVSMMGAQGGRGGVDSQGLPASGGYAGLITGTMAVTPGQVLTIAVGSGGATGRSSVAHALGTTPAGAGAAGGLNPLGTYKGGFGGLAGHSGTSGDGGGGGAATVITTSGATIVAAGAGGGGGSGQYLPLDGRAAYAFFTARPNPVSTLGQDGLSVNDVCTTSCDGGGSGAGGGGVIGGAQGNVEFGTGTYTEWFGYGGYPGSSDTASVSGLSSSYQFYAGNNGAGSVTISYAAGAPDVPTSVSGTAGDTTVALAWTAPASVGQSAITDYTIQYALASDPTNWIDFSDGVSTATTATVTGLTDGTAYIFQVSAVNAVGAGSPSAASSQVTPFGVPDAPTISTITPADGSFSVDFAAGASGSPITGYDYELNGSGNWVSSGATATPLAIAGLVNGTQYSVRIRAVSAIGAGQPSAAVLATPQALPGAPSITSTAVGVGSATIAFTPGFSGGAAITDYQYQLNGGSWVSSGSSTSPFTITGLANGTTYSVAIRAVNATGPGAASPSSSVTTPDLPAAPVVSSVVPGDSSVSIAFTPGATGGSTITSYQYQLTVAGAWTTAPSLTSPIAVSALVNGTTYAVSVRAVNAVGTGPGSVAQPATPATTPGAPTITGNTVAGSNLQLSAAFTPPTSDGGSAITTYQYSTDAGATWRVRTDGGSTASPVVITTLSTDGTTLLVNGITYSVELRAVNTVGVGIASAVATGIAQTVPSAPSITSVTAGPSSLAVVFAPAGNGGAAITAYQYQLGSGSWTDTGTLGTSFLIGGLANGTPYAVSVRAVNVVGNSTPSAPATGTPVSAPGQPTITSVTRADHSLSVAVTATDTGGSAITGWEYTTDGGATWRTAGVGITSPLTITTLSTDGTTVVTNGTGYPIAVRVINAVGTSVASAITTVAPSAAPSAPTIVLTPLNQAIQVAFTPGSDGGSPVSSIEYRLDGLTWINAGSLASPFTIAGLNNGTAYAVQVRANNGIGTGAASTPSSATPRTVPDAPTAVSAQPGTAQAVVSWTAPASNGGSPITAYVASAYASAVSATALATCTTATASCSIPGLTNTTTYYVSVIAQNVAGSGIASSPRVAVTPVALPSAPTLNTLTGGNTFVTLAFTAGSAGSSPITGYDYQLNGGAWQSAGSTASPITISGLTNGTSYTVALRATSAAGAGDPSSTLTATPFTAPNAPDSTTIVADGRNASIVVSWAAANNNGSAISLYSVVAWSAAAQGVQSGTCSTAGALTCTVTGLVNGTTYYVTVQSTNAAGASTRSTPRVPATPSPFPGAVSAVTGTAGSGQVALTWTAGSTGTGAITDYTIWYSSGGAYTQFTDGTSTATSATVTGLTNGVAYTFEVKALNSNGAGPVSAASPPVTPATVPDAPSIDTATPGNARAMLTWTAPVNNGGSAITGYVITPSGGSPITVGNVTSYTVTGLTNGTPYTFTVAAINTAGTGAASALSSSVTPLTTVADAPTIGTATPANTSATLTWTAPLNNGGAAITGYVITPSGGSPITVGNVTNYTVTGLTNGTAYTFTVAAINTAGTGGDSAASNSVTPATTVADAPTIGIATAGDTSATLTWTAPLSDGGLAISGYVITPSSGSPITVGNVTTYAVTGLTNGTAYTFTVLAINTAGNSVASAASNSVMPAAGSGGATTPTLPVRVGGPDRSATAIAASVLDYATTGNAGAVVLARSDDYPDALVGTTLAAAKHAPLLFSQGSSLSATTRAEIQRVLPAGGTVYLLGGVAAIPASVATNITALGYVPVRYAGADRFGTALAVADALGDPSTVLLATGVNFPDALAAGPAAAHLGGVVLLTSGPTMPASVTAYLLAHPGKVYAVGGPAVAADPAATALSGADRYATAAAVAMAVFSGPTSVGVASGEAFADALSGGAFEAHHGGPILLTTAIALPAPTIGYLNDGRSTIVNVTIFGGTSAVSTGVQTAVGTALGL
jgi:putative cell wall-binding protein